MGQCQDDRHTFLSCLADLIRLERCGHDVPTGQADKGRTSMRSLAQPAEPFVPALLRSLGDLAAYRAIQGGDQS
eukprot:4293004-Pyramimonas_sp.AAC.1